MKTKRGKKAAERIQDLPTRTVNAKQAKRIKGGTLEEITIVHEGRQR